MERITFSVVIPVYNRAGLVLPALESVQQQSFTDFECLVVDDGSSDGEELKALVEGLGDMRFRYIWRPNGGGGAARNTGINAAKGDWIAFLDSDDAWRPEKLATDFRCLTPGTVLFSRVAIIRDGRFSGLRPARGPRPGEPISEYLTCGIGWTPTPTLVVPGELVSRFCEQARLGQDTDFALRLAAEGFDFRMHDVPLVDVYDDEGARVSRDPDWRRVDTWLTEVSGLMTKKAFLAYRGWQVARIAAGSGDTRQALRFYAQALMAGAMPLPLAMKALGQILISRRLYRSVQRVLRFSFSGASHA